MKRHISLTLAFALLISLFVPMAAMAAAPAAGSDFKVVAYVPDWSSPGSANSWFMNLSNLSTITHINIAFFNPPNTSTWTIQGGSHFRGTNIANLTRFVDKAHEYNIKVLASLGGAGATSYVNHTSDANRPTFNANIIQFLLDNNLDGVDLDIEGDAPVAFWNNYENWVLELRALCDQHGLLLTTAMGEWYSQYVTDLAYQQFDFVNAMVYDMMSGSGPLATYTDALGMLAHFESRGVPREKLILGMPFYGRHGRDDWSDSAEATYATLLNRDPNAQNKDYTNMGATYRGDGYIYYNGMMTIMQKTDLAQRDYGGVMFWELSQDARDVGGAPHQYSLLNAIKTSLIDDKVYYPVIMDNGTIGTYRSEYDGYIGKATMGVGRYEAGALASVDAGTNGTKYFNGWNILAGGVQLDDPWSPQTTFTMPATHVILEATWLDVPADTALVSIKGPAAVASGAGAQAVYTISAERMPQVNAVELEFELDSDYLSGNDYIPNSVFSIIGNGNYGTDIFWKNTGSTWTGKVTLLDMSTVGISGDNDIIDLIFNVNEGVLGATEVKINYVKMSYGGQTVDTLIVKGAAGTLLEQWYSPYDLNKDGVIDLNDITYALQFLLAKAGDPNWNEAQAVDYDNSGEIGIEDLIVILTNYTVPYYS